MKPIILPQSYNYVAAFLTMKCNLGCPYCINRYGEFDWSYEMSAEKWVKGLSRIQTRNDLPITLQGGEPTLYRGFYDVVDGIRGKDLDLLTNGTFDLSEFVEKIDPATFNRDAPYASIRFSHHKLLNDDYLVERLPTLKQLGYSVGIWGFDTNDNSVMEKFCQDNEIDYRIKEFLSEDHGSYKYPEALDFVEKNALCKPSEMLIGPDGKIYRCHSDLYARVNSYAHILDEEIILPTDFSPCDRCGLCNPCDIKLKTNRLQQGGHCSVEIKYV